MNLTTIGWLLGIVSSLLGGALVAPTALALALGEPWRPFGVAIVIAGAFGLMTSRMLRRHEQSLDHRSAFLAVALSWVVACALGSVPYLLLPDAGMSLVDAWFESASGFTTTGATVLSQLETLPRSLLLWRAMTQWIGGMGIALIGVAVLPLLGIGGMSLYKAEAPGPAKDKLVPRISETAKIIWVLYLVLTSAGVGVLWLGGMTLFDAVCHAMCAVSTGGFGTHDASIGFTSSGLIHVATTVLMLLGGTSFAVLHTTVTRGLPWGDSAELRLYVAIFLVASLVVAFDLRQGMSADFTTNLEALDHATFQVASILTTTGFTTSNYDLWPGVSHAILFLLFFVGGMAGSTAGGVKVIRILLFVRQAFAQFFYLIHPRAVRAIKLGKQVVDDAVLMSIASFLAMWAVLIALGTVLFGLLGMDLFTAFSAAATTLGNIGPAFEGLGPAHSWVLITSEAKLLATIWMILGRLEIYTVLIILMPSFWRP